MNTIKHLLASLLLAVALTGVAAATDTVNINTADAAELARVLHNVGPTKAEAIVAWREDNGPFKSIEQLAQVRGIGLNTVERNRDRIELAPPRRPTAARPAPRPAAPATASR